MRKFVLTVIALVAMAAPAFAQIGDISVYADDTGSSCSIADGGPPGLLSVYVLHKHGQGSAAQFGMELAGGATLTPTGFTAAPGMLMLGTFPADISIAYGANCVSGDFLIGTASYFALGSSPPCSRIRFVPAPTSPIPGQIAIVDCAGAFLTPSTGQAIINPNGTCQCNVAVSETTWGSIKALYH